MQIRYLFEIWPGSRVVMQRTANPFTSVRFRPGPPNKVINLKKDLCRKSCIAIYRDDTSDVVPGSSAVEQAAVNRLAGGSNPSRGAKPHSHFPLSYYF